MMKIAFRVLMVLAATAMLLGVFVRLRDQVEAQQQGGAVIESGKKKPMPTTTKPATTSSRPRDAAAKIPSVSWPQFVTVTLDERGRVVSQQIKTAEYFTEDLGNGVTMDMVRIPGGRFLMGSPPTEQERLNDEGPQHWVTVKEFYMGRFEVTCAQWKAVSNYAHLGLNSCSSGDIAKNDQMPVVYVDRIEAVEFCNSLSKKTGKVYRLPSEAEWEYAARAGTTTAFAFGPTITPQIVNYNGNYPYGSVSKGIYRTYTVPVGSLGVANAFGLFDMHGNVFEWVQDGWHDNYNEAPDDGSAWEVKENGRSLLRGGSYSSRGYRCRSAYRGSGVGYLQYMGLRVTSVAQTRAK